MSGLDYIRFDLKINSLHQLMGGIELDNVLFLIVGGITYIGSAAFGILLFGEGMGAAFFALTVGSIGFYAFYCLLTKNMKD